MTEAAPHMEATDALGRWAATCEALGATSKKLEKRAILAEYLLSLPVADAARVAQYTAGEPFSEIDRRNLNIGGALLGKAVAQRSGADTHALTLAFRRHGDIGAAAEELIAGGSISSRDSQAGGSQFEPRPGSPVEAEFAMSSEPSPVLGDLENVLTEIAAARGPAAKLRLLSPFLARATPLECKYVLKLISGDMRIGVKHSLVEEAVAAAFRREIGAVRHAGMLLGSLPEVVERAAAGTLGEAAMRLFHPLGFMLASPVDSVDEAVARFAEEVLAEKTGEGPAGEPGEKPATKPRRSRKAAVAATEIPADAPGSPDMTSLSDALGTADTTGSLDVAALPENAVGDGPVAPEQLLREAQLEDKYDGMRAQLHAGDPREPGRVGLFSRNREDLRAAFPELVEAFAALPEAVILDGEILAWSEGRSSETTATEPEMGMEASAASLKESVGMSVGANEIAARALPFSSLQQRLGRKQVSPELRRTLPVVFMAFDILYADGRLLLDEPLRSRRARLVQYLATHAAATDGRATLNVGQAALFTPEQKAGPYFPRLLLASALTLESAAQLDAAYGEARARGNEGVMLKSSGSLYQPGRRGLAWLKLKRELATLDVVVTGAEFGTGRRAGYLSDYTFAVRGPGGGSGGNEEGELLNVGKAYSGVTDAEMHMLSDHFKDNTLEDFGSFRTVAPDTVFEVAFNNITRSDRHASGFALRFPRILRIRTDKPIAEIDTLARVEELYNQQPDRPVEVG